MATKVIGLTQLWTEPLPGNPLRKTAHLTSRDGLSLTTRFMFHGLGCLHVSSTNKFVVGEESVRDCVCHCLSPHRLMVYVMSPSSC